MRADAVRADRDQAVRTASDGWRRAGAIDEATRAAIVAAYPDDRVRLGLGLRILAGAAAVFGGGAIAVLLALVLKPQWPSGTALYAGTLAVLFAVATEIQVGPMRRAQAGAEYATALLAATLFGSAWVPLSGDFSEVVIGWGFATGFALAAWRWGYPSLAALGACLVLFACSEGGSGRGTWLILGLAVGPMMLIASRSPRWSPSHRTSLKFSGLIFLAGGYVATNILSVDHRWIGWLHESASTPPGAWSRRAAIAGTILLPPVVFGLGVRFRDRVLLAAGALFLAASMATLRQYHPFGPWWLALVMGGAACLALAVLLRRWLDAGPGHERWGFTAEPLFEDRRMMEAARAAATLVAMSPGPRTASPESFTGGGGRSGGGGATGQT